MHNTLLLYLILILVILILVMLAQKLKVAYPIVLVLGGLVISFIPMLPNITINPDVIFVVFLPPLLYEAAWQVSWKEFWKWRRVIGVFAFLIVVLTSVVVAYVSRSMIPGFTLALGFLLGGIVSPPDAVAATTIFKSIKVPKATISIAQGESLLNDAASLIVFEFALQAVNTGTFSWGDAILRFFLVIIGGIGIGLLVAGIFYMLHRWLPTTSNMDIILSIITPYFMYIIAEKVHVSGVLAVVSGGLFLSQQRNKILSYRSRFQGAGAWAILGFALNGLVFMLIGLALPHVVKGLGTISLGSAIGYGLLISGVLIAGRLLSTLGSSVFTVFISRYITVAYAKPGWRGPLVLGWAGMRGVVSLAAALSIPVFLDGSKLPFPERDLIIFITFIVILVTLVFQGLTLPLVVKWAKPEETFYPVPFEQQEIKLSQKLSQAALKFLDEKYKEDIIGNELLKNLQHHYQTDIALLEGEEEAESLSKAADGSLTKFLQVSTELFEEQRKLLMQINKKAEVDEDVIRKYQILLDIEEEKIRLRAGEDGEEV